MSNRSKRVLVSALALCASVMVVSHGGLIHRGYASTYPQGSSMHGPAVMSLLAGHEIGVAPEAKVHYYAYPSWNADHKSEADLFGGKLINP